MKIDRSGLFWVLMELGILYTIVGVAAADWRYYRKDIQAQYAPKDKTKGKYIWNI